MAAANTANTKRPGTARRYDSSRRARQAAQTRSEVLAAAVALFNEAGWAGTTLAAVAAEAGVAVETIYSGFGSKKGLFRAAMDAAVVGDADPIPFMAREQAARFGRGSLTQRLRAAAEVQAEVHERSAGVWQAILAAASADPEVDAWRRELELGRRVETGRALHAIFGRPMPQQVIDACWAVLAPEVYTKLTVDAGSTRAEYEQWVHDAVKRLAAK